MRPQGGDDLQTDPEQLVDLSVKFVRSKKAEDILVIDLRRVTDIADFFILCTGNSDTHVEAIADALVEGMEGAGYRPWHIEGYGERNWVLIDFVDVVVHIFQREPREFYALERLWGDAKIQEVEG